MIMVAVRLCMWFPMLAWLVRRAEAQGSSQSDGNWTTERGEATGAMGGTEVGWVRLTFSDGARLQRLSPDLQDSLISVGVFSESILSEVTECWWSQPCDEEEASSTILDCDVRGRSEKVRINVHNLRKLSGACTDGQFDNNGVCTACIAGCKTCTDASSCSVCVDGYYSDGAGGCGLTPPPCHAMCDVCTSPPVCTQCKPGYHFSSLGSLVCSDQCPANCQACSNDSVCTACKDGFFLLEGECPACHSSCKTCVGYAKKCLACSGCLHPFKSTVVPGECTAICPLNCNTCADILTCTGCFAGYQSDGSGGCKVIPPCHAMCQVCPSPPVCVQCKPGFHLARPGSLICSDQCPVGCLSCSSDDTCDICQDGYFMNPISLCSACHKSCKTCVEAPDKCLSCAGCLHPFDARIIPTTCSAICPPDCISCSDQLSCTQCKAGFVDNGFGGCIQPCHPMCDVCLSRPVCSQCKAGYHIAFPGSLVCSDLCPANCAACSADAACDQCKDGYFLTPGKLCSVCRESCKTCVGSSTSCLVCNDCLHPLNKDAVPGECSAKCPPFCMACDDELTCTQCIDGYITNVLNGCSLRCHAMCAVCPSPPVCISCKPGYHLVRAGSLVCSDQCPSNCSQCSSDDTCDVCDDGYIVSNAKLCAPCHSTCKTCVGKDTNCIQCASGLHPFNSKVVPGVCSELCPMFCQACSDESTCTQCLLGYQGNNNGGCVKTPCPITQCLLCAQNVCIQCATGYSYDAASVACLQICTPGYKCSFCLGGECKTCQAPYTQISGSINCQLTSCGDPNCLDCSSTQCSLCDSGWKLVPGSAICLKICDQYCEYCSATQCLTCIDSTYEPVANTLSCRLKCSSHTYRNAQQTCSECDSTCVECTLKSTSCISCSQGLVALLVLPGKCTANCSASCSICVSPAVKCVVCSTGYFPTRDVPGTCTSICDMSCYSCYPSSITCLACANNYLPQTILPGVCVSSCNTACATCSGAANKCTACKKGYQPATTLPGPCMDKTKCHPSCRDKTSCPNAYEFCTACSQGYSLNGDYCMRETCHSSCITCNGPDYTDCLSCPPTANFVSSIGICLYTSCAGLCQSCYGPEASQCLTCMQNSSKTPGSDFCSCNMYFKLQTNVCIYNGPCHESCTSCSNAGIADCLSCPRNAQLTFGQCNCVLDYEWTSALKACVFKGICQPQCRGCSGPRVSDCIACPEFATIDNGMCTCLPAYSWNTDKSQCDYTGVCDSICVTCKGPLVSQCITCTDTENGSMVGSMCTCNNGFVWNQEVKKCAYLGACMEAFSVCSGPNDSQGLICDMKSIPVETGCKCAPTFSWDSNVNACTSPICDPICDTCRGDTSFDCVSCNTSLHHVLNAGTCICASGYFGAIISKTTPCSACHLTCKNCIGGDAQSCTECFDNASLNPVTSACDCLSGYYLNPDIGLCYPCHDICGSCSGPLTTNCLSCRELFQMDGMTCVCQTGYFYLSKANTCEHCHASCLTCSGPAQTQCLSCTSVQVLTSGTCNCIDTTKYNDGGKCSDCYVGCLTCAGLGPDMCLSCYPSALLFLVPGPSSCACVDPLRPAPTPNVCKNCPVTCSNCDIVDPNRCTACKTNSVSVSGSFPSACVCRASYYFDSGTESCTMCDQSCASCSDSSPFSCLACKKYANEGGLFCEEYCPAGLSPRDGVCVAGTNPLIFSLSFSHLSTNKDIESSYAAVLASTSATVPVVIYQQGVRLQSGQFVRLPPNTNDPRSIVFAASHYIEMWVKPSLLSASQVIMNKRIAGATLVSLEFVNSTLAVKVFMYSLTVPAGTNVTPLYTSSIATTVQVSGGEFVSNSAWVRVGYSVQLTGRNSLITIFANGVSLGTSMQTGMLFRDFSGAEWMLGTNSGNSFQGQIAEVRVFLGTKPGITPIGCLCPVCTSSGMCLSSCSIYEYYSTTCAPCLSTCRDGCIRGSDCRNNKDPLCSVFTDFYECLQCGNLSMMNSGTCVCVEDSVFSESAAACRCKEGTQPSGNQCVTCQSYFRPDEVTAAMDTSFLTATLTFARAVIPSISACSDIFDSATLDKFGLSPTCAFDSTRKVLTVYFGTGVTVLGEPLVLLNKKLVSSEGACSAISNALAPMLRLPEAPVPVVMLATAGQYSIPCGSDEGLTMSAAGSSGGAGRPLSYRWIFKAVPAIMSVSDYMTYNPNQSSITISRSVMKATKLAVTVYVKNVFGKEASLTRSVQILGNTALSIAIEGGTKAFITSNQKYMFKAKLNSSCGTELPSLTFKWEQTAGPTASGITSATSSLEIKKNSLQGGEVYSFKCSVIDAQSRATGEESLELTVAKGPLIAQCTRGDGEQSFSKDIVINCNGSMDTDAPTSADLIISWTCKQNNNPCKSTQGTVLLMGYTSLGLMISAGDLAVGTGYIFTLTVSKDVRQTQVSIRIDVVPATDCEIAVEMPQSRLSASQDVKLQPVVKAPVGSTFLWSQTNGPSLILSTPSTSSFLGVASGAGVDGQTYTFDLKVTPPGGPALTASVTLKMNAPPTGGKFSVSPISGSALITIFSLAQAGWEDPDMSDYPITAQFGYAKSGKNVFFSVPSVANDYKTTLFPGNLVLITRICDSLDSCSASNTTVTVLKGQRLLTNETLIEIFDRLTVDEDLVPTACVVFANSVDMQGDVWTHVLGRLVQYASSFSDTSESQLEAEVNCLKALSSSQTSEKLQALLDAAKDLSSSMTLSRQAFANLFSAFQDFDTGNLTDALTLKNYTAQLQQRYLRSSLPEETGIHLSGTSMELLGLRDFPLLLSGRNLSFENATISLPFSFHFETFFLPSAVVDLRASLIRVPDFPTAILDVSVYLVGTYSDYSFYPVSEKLVEFKRLTNKVRLVLPVYHYDEEAEYSCFSQVNQTWDSFGCTIVDMNRSSVTVETSHLSVFTVYYKEFKELTPEAMPIFVAYGLRCDKWHAPIYILVGIVVIPLLFITCTTVQALIRLSIARKAYQRQAQRKPQAVSLPDHSDENCSSVMMYVSDERSLRPSSESSFQGRFSVAEEHSLSIKMSVSDEHSHMIRVNATSERSDTFRGNTSDGQSLVSRVSIPDEHSEHLNAIDPSEICVDVIAPIEISGLAANQPHRIPSPPLQSPDQSSGSEGDAAVQLAPLAYGPIIVVETITMPQGSDTPDIPHEEVRTEPISKMRVMLDGHYLLGLLWEKHWLRWEKMLCLLTVLVSHLGLVGMFYYYEQDSRRVGEVVANEIIWDRFITIDAQYYAYSFLLTLALSMIISILFFQAESHKGRARVIWLLVSILVCLVVSSGFGVMTIFINVQLCYEYVGRWCIGFFFCVLTEVLVLEFLVAAVKFLLVRKKRGLINRDFESQEDEVCVDKLKEELSPIQEKKDSNKCENDDAGIERSAAIKADRGEEDPSDRREQPASRPEEPVFTLVEPISKCESPERSLEAGDLVHKPEEEKPADTPEAMKDVDTPAIVKVAGNLSENPVLEEKTIGAQLKDVSDEP